MMRAIQITIDEALLKALDRDSEVRAKGRSAVLRRVLSEYLKSNRRAAISQAYRRGYGKAGAPELKGWADEGTWPEE
jgi:metal-responsive CopG/Arc/MetJ family transcriptional regulator